MNFNFSVFSKNPATIRSGKKRRIKPLKTKRWIMSPEKTKKRKPSVFNRILNGIERVGNKLPHPITLFGIFALAIILISALCSWLGVSATGELIDSHTLETTTQTVTAVSLLSRDGIVYMLTNLIGNFTSFAPLGVVLVTMLGVGCAEGSGFLSAALKKWSPSRRAPSLRRCSCFWALCRTLRPTSAMLY